MRSHLLVPTNDEKKLEAAFESEADCLWLDLECALGAVPKARELALSLLRAAREKPLYVCPHSIESGEIDADLDTVMKGAPDGIVLAKSRGGADIQHLGAKLALREAEYDLADGSTRIIAVAAQTPAAIFKMGTYAGASRRLAALCWGPDELAIAIGAKAPPDGSMTGPYTLARNLTLMAAKAAGVAAIDSVYADPDRAGLKAACEAARRDGFAGKLALDADQAALINAYFT
jgi:citrate lyase subunit beta / citryl-CoA lyase